MQRPDSPNRQRHARSAGILLGAILVLSLFWAGSAWSSPLVLLSEDSPIYRQVGDEIRQAYRRPLRFYTTDTLPARTSLKAELAIAVGARACEQLMQRTNASYSLICAFIPRATFTSLMLMYAETPLIRQQRVTAIYLDQPMHRQLRLARLLVPDAKSIGTMFGPYSVTERDRFLDAARDEHLTPVSITLLESDNPIEKLTPVVSQSDVFLALPDRALFNRATAKWLLYITLRQQIPIIGFSRTYVEAGALAAVYSTPAQIGRQIGEALVNLHPGAPLQAPANPRYFTVTSNPVVARSLHLPVPDDAALTRSLEEASP